MKKSVVFLLCAVLCVATVSSVVTARNAEKGTQERYLNRANPVYLVPPSRSSFSGGPGFASAAQGTTVLGSWTFDSGPNCVAQGWVTEDLTAQLADFVQVEDFAGLAGGTFGRLFALEGIKSLWIGARPDAGSSILCGYAALPGYGNGWNQAVCSRCFTVGTGVSVDFLVTWDSEPGYDGTDIEIDNCDGNWLALGTPGPGGLFDGSFSDSLHVQPVADSLHAGSLRVRFHFQSDGAWSDQDGLWDTDGGVIIDSLTVRDDSGVLSFQNFETEAVGATATADGDWAVCTPSGYGDFAGLFPGLTLIQEDPCFSDITCMWGFFSGSTETYACGGFPGTTSVPKGNADGQ